MAHGVDRVLVLQGVDEGVVNGCWFAVNGLRVSRTFELGSGGQENVVLRIVERNGFWNSEEGSVVAGAVRVGKCLVPLPQCFAMFKCVSNLNRNKVATGDGGGSKTTDANL